MDEGFSKFLYDAAGEPVPQVDPDEVKVVWEWQRKMEREHPGQLVAVAGGGNITEPTANVRAVGYRATMLLMLRNIAPETRPRMPRAFTAIRIRRSPAALPGYGTVTPSLPASPVRPQS